MAGRQSVFRRFYNSKKLNTCNETIYNTDITCRSDIRFLNTYTGTATRKRVPRLYRRPLRPRFWGNHEAYFYYGASTTHGRQFNPHLFVGGGMDLEYNPSFGRTIFALYAAGRTDWQFGRYTPYGDVRLGLSTSGGGGVYFSPTVGYRFNWGRKASINVGLGLTLKSKNMESYDFTILPDGSGLLTPLGRKHLAECLFAIRLGVEFGK